MFKKATDKKPFKSLSLVHGKINQDENQVIIDGKTGERVQYFEFQFMDASGKKKKGKPMSVIPQESNQFDHMVFVFTTGAK